MAAKVAIGSVICMKDLQSPGLFAKWCGLAQNLGVGSRKLQLTSIVQDKGNWMMLRMPFVGGVCRA